MKTTYSIIFCIGCLILSSCANVVVNYGNPSPNTGNIVIKTTSRVYANLTVNDSLLVLSRFASGSGKYVRNITIKNVPAGVNTVHFSANSQNLKNAMDNKLEVTVEKGKTNTQLLTVPPKRTGYLIGNALLAFLFGLLLGLY